MDRVSSTFDLSTSTFSPGVIIVDAILHPVFYNETQNMIQDIVAGTRDTRRANAASRAFMYHSSHR